MRKALLAATLGLILAAPQARALPPVSTTLTALPVTATTGEKPQSKVWTYAGRWWCVMPNSAGTWVWRLDGAAWTNVLQLSSSTSVHADVKATGAVTHVLLFGGAGSQLASIEYVPATQTYQPWSTRPANVALPLDGSTETATIEVDTAARMWLVSDHAAGADQIVAYWSDAPYTSWSGPVTLAAGINGDDIAVVTALPGGRIGVLWSNQNTWRFGFRTHADGADPATWTADEQPASQSALNVGLGMADDHLHVAVASDGTLYAAVKTSYDTAGYPKIALLVRRPAGTWDDLYEVDQAGTRGIVLLDEAAGRVTVVYTSTEGSGDILYKESPTSAISFSGPSTVLIPGGLNDATSLRENLTGSVVILAGNGSSLAGRLLGPAAADFTITATAGPGGSITPAGAVGVSSGASQTFTITADPDYAIDDVQVDAVSVGAVTGYTFTNVIANHTIAATFRSTLPPAGLVGWWRMDGNVDDASGHGYHATAYGAPGYVTGMDGQALALSGAGQYAAVPDNAALRLPGNAFTLATWVRPTVEGTQNLISKSTNGGVGGYELCLAATSSTWPHKAFFRLNQVPSGDTYRINSTTNYSDHLDQWMHLAATFDGATMRLYVNGVAEGSLPAPIALAQNTLPVGLGAQVDAAGTATRFLAGALDDARIYDHALTAAEIAALAQQPPPVTHTITASAGAGGAIAPSGAVTVTDGASQAFSITPATCYVVADVLVDGVSVGAVTSYTFSGVTADHTIAASFAAQPAYTITASAGPNGAISPAGAVPVACGASQAFTITASGGYHVADVLVDGGSVGAVTSYTFTAVQAAHTIAASFTADTPAGDLVGRWRMDEGSGTVVHDDSPNGLDGTAVGNPAWVAGVNGPYALSFTNGTAQYVTVPSSTPLNLTGAITLAAWIRPTRTATASVLNKAVFNSSTFGYELNLGTSGMAFVRLANDSQTAPAGGRLNATIAYPTNGTTWQHVAATFDGATLKLYINGVLNVSRTCTTPIPTNGQPFVIGAPSDGLASRVFPGAIDDARIYNRALTDAEIAALASLTPTWTITASAGPGGTITPSGAVAVTQGADQAFAIAAGGGYQIADVEVDGGSVGAVGAYTFTNVTANHTIAATFAALTTTRLASDHNPADFGSPVTLTATVSPAPLAGGTVTFLDGAVTLGTGATDGSGAAALTTSALAVGTHPITARFEGDAAHAGSVSPALSQVVNALSSTLDVGPAPGLITLANPVRSVPVTIRRQDLTPLLGFSVRLTVSPELAASGGLAGFHEGTYLSAANPNTSFNQIDLGLDGAGAHVYEVDGATLGAPCGASAADGTLFTLDLAGVATGGTGRVAIESVRLRNCSNADLPAVLGTASLVALDRSAPLVQVAAPNGGETWPIGATRTITWTGSDPEGVAGYDLAYSTDGGATYPYAIASLAGAQASYDWTVPATASATARVRVTARDVNGNPGADASDADFALGCPVLAVTAATTPVACHGGATGAIDVSVGGGAPPYRYLWADGPTAEDRAGLAAGSYSVTVTDANDCTGNLLVEVPEPAVLVASETHTDACGAAPDGAIDLSVEGGTAPYGYLWNDGATTQDRASLAAGGYAVTVTDARGCTAGLEVAIGVRGYTIAASAGPHGTIAPSGAVPVLCGASQAFTLTPDPGCHVADVTVDGGSVGAVDAYTFPAVTGDHVIAASFAVNPPVPALAHLTATPIWSGNPAGGTTGVRLAWDATANTVEVWRAGFGHYPEYDDAGGAAPVASPTYPPGPGWVKTDVAAPGGVDYVGERDFWYYVAYQRDVYGTWSPASALTPGRLNYILGDVSDGVVVGAGNDDVRTEDVSALGAHYGLVGDAVTPYAYLDIGPTSTNFVDGLPLTDDVINFEDLVLMAIDWGATAPPASGVTLAGAPGAAAGATGTAAAVDGLALEAPAQVVPGTPVTARLLLQGAGDLVALSTALAWDPAVVEPTGQAAGAWLAARGGVAFSAAAGTVDAAVFTPGGLAGEGELATVTFRALAAGDPRIRIAAAEGRDGGNRRVAIVTSDHAPRVVPAVTQLAPARPNPSRGTVTLAFSLAKDGRVGLRLFAVDGRRVRTLLDGVRAAGEYGLTWDGRDDHGRALPAGVYYLRLDTPEGRHTRTLTFLP